MSAASSIADVPGSIAALRAISNSVLFFALVFGRGVDIDAEGFTAAHPVGMGITDGRIEIEIERDASTRYNLLAKENFGACIHMRCELKDLMRR